MPFRVLTIAILAAMLAFLFYRDALTEVVHAVLNREDSSHGLFVPFLVIWFIWIIRGSLTDLQPRYDLIGIPIVALGLLPVLINLGNFQIQYLALIVLLIGLIACILGRPYLRHLTFPVLFLSTMTPIPENLYNQIADFLRSINFWASLKILDVFNVPYYRQGWLLQLPDSLLKVAIGCSGIRYLISYFVFAAAYGYLFKTTLRGRLFVILLSVPISILASTLRLSTIFLLSYHISPKLAEHGPHVIISWIVFFTILVLSIFTDQYISDDRDQNPPQKFTRSNTVLKQS